MALSGKFVTLDTVLNKIRINTGSTVDEESALEWVAEVLETVAPQDMLTPMLTDGNKEEGHHDPIPVVNYRAKLPCDMVIFKHAFEANSFRQLRTSMSNSHFVNTPDNAANVYKPDFWYRRDRGTFGSGQANELPSRSSSYPPNLDIAQTNPPTKTHAQRNGTQPGGSNRFMSDGTYQLKKGYVYTDFESGSLIVSYLGWPMDEDENLLIPGDAKVIQAMVSYIQHKVDYQLWRSGDIADKVYNDSEQNALWDVPAAGTHALMPSEDGMETISNMVRKMVRNDNYFDTHFVSVGRRERYRNQR